MQLLGLKRLCILLFPWVWITGVHVNEFVTFTRQDGYAFTVRRESVAAFMPAGGEGTLIWLKGAAGADFQHVRDKVAKVQKLICGVAEAA